MKDNLIIQVSTLLHLSNVRVSKTAIKEVVLRHPDYPSLLSISDALKSWNVDNISLNISFEKLTELSPPFLVRIDEESPAFVVVKLISDTKVIYRDPEKNKKWKCVGIEDFKKIWTGVVLLPDAMRNAGEKKYRFSRRKELIDGLVPGLLLFLILLPTILSVYDGFLLHGRTALFPSLLITLKLAGVVATSLLLWHEVDNSNSLLEAVCGAGKHANCNAVLQSPAARIGGLISWSEAGFAYFSGSFLLLLISDLDPFFISTLAWLNLVALPYTVFSVYYQWKIARQWCVLCLTVQALILLEFAVATGGRQYAISLPAAGDTVHFMRIASAFFLPVTGWLLIKKYLLQAAENEKNKIEIARIKHNTQIFETLLVKQKAAYPTADDLGIILGKSDAKNKIIKVCNPFCGPCAKAHPVIEDILENVDDVKIQILFNPTADESTVKYKTVSHLLAIASRNVESTTLEALNDWYNSKDKDYDSFAAKYQMKGELMMQGEKIKAMNEWCKKNEITFTPTFYINGYRLPEVYKLIDIKNILAMS